MAFPALDAARARLASLKAEAQVILNEMGPEKDLSKVQAYMPMFEALARGYLEA